MPILIVATDFSPRSDRALRRASLLARQLSGEMLVAYVSEGAPGTESVDYAREPEPLLKDIEHTITAMDGLPCQYRMLRGTAEEELCDLANISGARLVVVGPHNRSLITDMFGAITVERIAGQSPVSVLAANGVPAAPYRKVLLPVDMEDGSKHTVETLHKLGIAGNARIVLLHIYDAEAREMMSQALVPGDSRRDYLKERAEEAYSDLRAFANSTGLENAALLVEEALHPATMVVERVAEEEQADLLVVSRSAKSAAEKGFLGSLTGNLMRNGKSDLLIVPYQPER